METKIKYNKKAGKQCSFCSGFLYEFAWEMITGAKVNYSFF